MTNQIVLVGRIKEVEDFSKDTIFVYVEVKRPFKDENGEYKEDIIQVNVSYGIKDNLKKYCGVGDLIGVKGRLEAEGRNLKVVAEKITFLHKAEKEN